MVHMMLKVSGSNLGLRKCAYFIKNCTLIEVRLVVVADQLGYFLFFNFGFFFIFLENDLQGRIMCSPVLTNRFVGAREAPTLQIDFSYENQMRGSHLPPKNTFLLTPKNPPFLSSEHMMKNDGLATCLFYFLTYQTKLTSNF